MSKFKIGDRVRYTHDYSPLHQDHDSVITEVHNGMYTMQQLDAQKRDWGAWDGKWHSSQDGLELVTTKENKPMGRRTFKLLKDTPQVAKGALYQEACDDGTQEYVIINRHTHVKGLASPMPAIHERSLVEDAPNFFVEVFQVTPQYMTQAELDQWEAFKKAQKPVAKKRGRPAKKGSK